MAGAALGMLAAGIGQALFQNQLNNESARQQRNWLREEYALTRKYNSPVEQRQRLRAGGFNPGIAMQNGMMDSGASTPPPAYDRAVPDFSPVGNAVNGAVQYLLDKKRTDAEVRLQNENTIAQQQRNKFGLYQAYLETLDKIAELHRKGADTDFLKKQAGYMQKQISAYDRRNDAEVNRIDKEAAVAEEQANLLRLQASTQEIINEYLPQEKRRALQVSDATVRQLLSAANANDADAAYKAAAKLLTEAQAKGVNLDNQQKDAIMDAIVDDAFNKAEGSYWNASNARQEAGKIEAGVGPLSLKYRERDDNARDVYHQRVRHDKNGRKYIYDARSNKRIYLK